jgi:hypothetical protein
MSLKIDRWAKIRVDRFVEFSPIGRLFSLSNYLKADLWGFIFQGKKL